MLLFNRTAFRVSLAFWLFGLINNVLYVIILSAALDLVGPSIPKSAVLLFDVVPSFFTKLTAPYYVHVVPYPLRVVIFVALSTCGMLLIALTPSSVLPGPGEVPTRPATSEILVKMSGVVLASLSSGGGELSFLALTHFYGPSSLAAWGSGTGGAGLVGAGAYVLATTTLALTVKTTLLVSAFLPLIMLMSFFVILPRAALIKSVKKRRQSYERVPETGEDGDDDSSQASSGLLAESPAVSIHSQSRLGNAWTSFEANLQRAKGLVLP